MAHDCAHEKEFEDIKKLLYGNGRPGMLQEVTMLTVNVDLISDNINKMDAKLEKLLEFYNKGQGRIDYKMKEAGRSRWLIGTIIAIIAVLAVFVVEFLKK